jgi:hypothetical protein
MVIMTPYQADASGKAPRLEAPKVEVKKIEEAEEVEEVAPKKRESKKVADPVVKEDLDDVLDAWTKGD